MPECLRKHRATSEFPGGESGPPVPPSGTHARHRVCKTLCPNMIVHKGGALFITRLFERIC